MDRVGLPLIVRWDSSCERTGGSSPKVSGPEVATESSKPLPAWTIRGSLRDLHSRELAQTRVYPKNQCLLPFETLR